MRKRWRIAMTIANVEDVPDVMDAIPDNAREFRLECAFVVRSGQVTSVLDAAADRVFNVQIQPVVDEEQEEEGNNLDLEDLEETPPKRKHKKSKKRGRVPRGEGAQTVLKVISSSDKPVHKSEFSPAFVKKGMSTSNISKILLGLLESKQIQKAGTDSYKLRKMSNEKPAVADA